MKFEIIFYTPFRVASGRAGDGSDVTVDRGTLLPASSLKGLMRSAARDLLKFPGEWVGQVFGTGWRESPWSWSDAQMTGRRDGEPEVRPRARIRIDADTLTVTHGALLIADEVVAARADFSIERIGWVEPSAISTQQTVLLAAARAVTAVGGDRRRGLGWVTITPIEPQWSQAHLQAAINLAHPRRPPERPKPPKGGADSGGAQGDG